jgi:hypothetical protein
MLDPEVCQHVFELAEGLRLFPGFLGPCDVIRILQPFEHFLINFDGKDDLDGFSLAGDDFRLGHFRFYDRRVYERGFCETWEGGGRSVATPYAGT